jgi:hypothetical protein
MQLLPMLRLRTVRIRPMRQQQLDLVAEVEDRPMQWTVER